MLDETKDRMQKAIDHLRADLAQIRTSRANPSLISDVEISAYDSKLTIKELAQITAPQQDQIIISPYDNSIIGNIAKGIEVANLGLSPQIDNDFIRITIPPLTEERRREFVETLHQKLELYRVEIRQIRHDMLAKIKRAKEEGEFGEDEQKRLEKQIDDETHEFTEEIDEIGESKEKEILQV